MAAQKRQMQTLVVRATEGVSRGMPTLPQTAWLPTGDELVLINRALADLDAIIAIDSTQVSAHNARGMCLARAGNYPEALAAYGRAFELCGGHAGCRAGVLNNIGDVFAEQCSLKDAEDRYRASLRAYDSVLARANLAACLLNQNRVDEALHEIVDVIDVDPNFVGVPFVYGKILWRRNERDAALRQLRQAVQIDPKYQPETHLALSKALLATEDLDSAVDEAAAAVDVAPGFAEGHAWYAEVLRRKGDINDAAAESKKARALMTSRKPHGCPDAHDS